MAKIEIVHNPLREMKQARFAMYFDFLARVSQMIFYSSLFTYAALFLLEQVYAGMVSTFVRLVYLLYVTVVAGAISIMMPVVAATPSPAVHKRQRLLLGASAGIVAGVIVYQQVGEMGSVRFIIAIVSGLFVALFGVTITSQDKENL